MKYGKYLESRKLELPEYLPYFMNYKALKKLIKSLATVNFTQTQFLDKNGKIDFNNNEVGKILQENNASFFFRIERELEKVNSFYIEKEADLKLKLDILLSEKNNLLLNNNISTNNSNNNNNNNKNNNDNYNDNNNTINNNKNTSNLLNNNDPLPIDNTSKSISFKNLVRNFQKFNRDLDRLSQFVELNETGFRKILKKWDKRSKSHLQEIYISTTINVQPVFHRDEINQLSDLVANSLLELEAYSDGENLLFTTQPNQSNNTLLFNNNNIINKNNENNFISNDDNNRETDELYSEFVNISLSNNNEQIHLKNWLNKLSNYNKPENLTKIFFLSISTSVLDLYLQEFYNFFQNFIDFNFNYIDTITNKNFLHQISSCIKFKDFNPDKSRLFLLNIILNKAKSQNGSLLNLLKMTDSNGKIPLHYACQYGRIDLIPTLLQNYPNCSITDHNSLTPLLLTIANNHLNCMKLILDFSLNKHNQEIFQEKPLEKSQEKSQESQNKPQPSIKSVDGKLKPQDEIDIPKYLALNYACEFGNYEIIKMLLDENYSSIISKHSKNVQGLFPLHTLAIKGHYQIVDLLISSAGSLPNQFDSFNKWTPIFYAASYGHARTAKKLIKNGASISLKDHDGYTPLYYAAWEGHVKVFNVLLDASNMPPPININPNTTSSPSNIPTPKNKPITIADYVKMTKNAENKNDFVKSPNSDNLMQLPINFDSIPDLSLPPPIIPLRKYGHNFLEKKIFLQLIFPPNKDSIKFFKKRQYDLLFNSNFNFDSYLSVPDISLIPGRITLSSKATDLIPRNLLWPISDNDKFVLFQIDDIDEHFSIDFELFPTFGTKLIAKTTALSNLFLNSNNSSINLDGTGEIILPLFDSRLKNIGEINFRYQIIYPYPGVPLEITKYDTYWKTTDNNANNNNSISATISNFSTTTKSLTTTSFLSFVTASSLSGYFLKLNVCLLNDGRPVICPRNTISAENGIEINLINLNYSDLLKLTKNHYNLEEVGKLLSNFSKTPNSLYVIKEIQKIIENCYLPLEFILEKLSNEISLNLEIIYPTIFEIKNFVKIYSISSPIPSFQQNYVNKVNDVNLNNFIDSILTIIFEHVRLGEKEATNVFTNKARSIIFSSYNPTVCTIFNWKQPNFPVLFNMGGIRYNPTEKEFKLTTAHGNQIEEEVFEDPATRSIKEAIKFSTMNNLLGIMLPSKILSLIPDLIPSIRSRELILVASKDDADLKLKNDIKNEVDYFHSDINGMRINNVLSFKDAIDM
ncbi:ankyrin [Ascoidea rubescens DSM 1968]|uniref:Ankyrin n=1 Tax=Ascoidea rubescens DSM 1968 TaxID=1344418 RepID=A0A1D2VCM8_9ASCO|nr:ankyrin [Ascoidea rubescens DSM 1968]ODV59207.1 ankyrin [Ascoidea rubescens DSM 1968]